MISLSESVKNHYELDENSILTNPTVYPYFKRNITLWNFETLIKYSLADDKEPKIILFKGKNCLQIIKKKKEK